jgi:hypothetical protein
MSQCRSCNAEILWCITDKNGAKMPLDLEANREGYWVKVELKPNGDKIVHRLNREEQGTDTRTRYTSHFETCPNASQHSKK